MNKIIETRANIIKDNDLAEVMRSEKGFVECESGLDGLLFNNSRYYDIWLPNQKSDVPLIVYLGGMLDENSYRGRANSYPDKLEKLLSNILKKYKLTEMAFLAVPGPVFNKDEQDIGINTEDLELYTNFIWKNMIPTIEEHYMVGGSFDKRAAIGFSAGGAVAMKMALASGDFYLAAAHSCPYLGSFISLLDEGKAQNTSLIADWGSDEAGFAVHLETMQFRDAAKNAAAQGKVKEILDPGNNDGIYEGHRHHWGYASGRVRKSIACALNS